MSDAMSQHAPAPWRASVRPPGLPMLGLAVSALLFAIVALQLETGLGGPTVSKLCANWLYDGIGLAAVFACFSRAFAGRERAAWLLIGLGILAWTVGDIYWTVELEAVANPPFPSLA